MIKTSKKFKLHTALALLLIGLVGCQPASSDSADTGLPGEGRVVRPAATPTLVERFQLEVVNIGLKKLGYQVQSGKELEPAATHIAIANGDLDYTALHYEILHNKFFVNAGGEEKIQRVGKLIDDVVQAYQIDKATADRHNITNIKQLQNPEIARLFDSDGDGKANLVGCNPGWGCELANEHHMDAYGLRDTVEIDKGKYTVLIADTVTRHQQGESVLYYAWETLLASCCIETRSRCSALRSSFYRFTKRARKLYRKRYFS